MTTEELTVTLDAETYTFPSLGVVVIVGTINGGDPFVLRQEVGSDGR